jgi:hypothetical protein
VDGEHDADVVAAGLTKEFVEAVEVGHGAVAARWREFGRGQKQGVNAKRAESVESNGERLEVDGAGLRRFDLVEERALPPRVDVDAIADPARVRECLRLS